ncbi:receptor-like protein 15 [Tripterygium wilfordii]|uniref:receptor-like protein 15 n=1 Tax=Tripterygium wilfordii TaxID=458696 RepID=UPI0018F83410|nr:receptor-like protein 15 [Tripterygium wilfordii]
MHTAELFNLSTLEELFLDRSSLHKDFLQTHVGSNTSLKVLHLNYCGLKGTLSDRGKKISHQLCIFINNKNEIHFSNYDSITGWCDLKNLEDLDLGYNELEGALPPCMANLSSIRILDLSYNHFQISLRPFANHLSLKHFWADGNELIDEAASQPWTPKFQLEELQLSNCIPKNSNASFPNFLYHQFNLRYIDLSNSKFGGAFPSWLFENNTRLQEIYLANNSFVGPFHPPSHPIPNIYSIDISLNRLQGQIPSNITSLFPNLESLDISKNSFQGTIPPSLGELKSLYNLDLSNNQFSGEIKEQFANSSLKVINLSNNQFSGEIKEQFANSSLEHISLSNNKFSGCIPPMFDPKNLRILRLDGNNFVGKIPDLSSLEYLENLDISHNSLSGKFPRWVANMSTLSTLVLADNKFEEGSIPLEFCELHQLQFLDLSRSNLSGSLPPCFNELANLKHVHLRGNKLRGPIPQAFLNCTGLQILDLGGNNFNGPIPNWIGNFSSLNALFLQANNLHGEIPIELCRLHKLNMLVLSSNNLSGNLPVCLSNLLSTTTGSLSFYYDHYTNIYDREMTIQQPYKVEEVLEFRTKSNSLNYTGYILDNMYGIDLSCNKFSGEIPIEFGNLSNVRSLNLSHNNMTGLIPTMFSNLKQLESLDLSYNDLHGRIPTQLSEVTSLAVFIVAYNNLSGPVPLENQFGTFNETSYEGNPLLCGLPLNKSCNETNVDSPARYPFIEQSEDDNFMEITDFWISFVVAYAVILLSMAIVLYINPYWRPVWFYHMQVWIDTCYYFVVDKFQ